MSPSRDDDDDNNDDHVAAIVDPDDDEFPFETSSDEPSPPQRLRLGKFGGKEFRTTTTTTATTTNRTVMKKPLNNNSAILERRMMEAKYEIDVDAYRGVCATTQEALSASPWLQSCGGARIDDDDAAVADTMDEHEALEVIRFASNSTCPTLLRWTLEARKKAATIAKRKRKRKDSKQPSMEETVVVGVRPDDANLVCECDSNPFCLATLGGVMNDVLLEKAKVLQIAKYSQPDDDDDDDDDDCVMETTSRVQFSSLTKMQLDSIRKSVYIDTGPIKEHLKPLMKGLMSLSDAIANIRASQQKLVFINPVNDSSSAPRARRKQGSVLFAVPPGISNLGATCYLNTQLQCLAQNLVFTRGIFQWRPPPAPAREDKMSTMIQQFQELLMRMREGAANTCCALEWTTALGLDHSEQQDPNEFSRLLLARMAESFQSQAHALLMQDGQYNLPTLLADLFEGAMVYETKCSKCGTISRRKEEFEDINLPIEKKPARPKTKGLMGYMPWTKDNTDTNVQYCLERYCQEEILDDDNQYFCSVCNAKQNATRRTVFSKLPPCLNIQLCRYVYNRDKGEKKKLSDKVLLPTELRVELVDMGEIQQRIYVLCAVMRHKGTTAYSGHYVAEAMDWTSGQWFEFNDETVTHLESGPTCSYDPSSADHDSSAITENGKEKKLSGSNEAYNMYYVEREFLAQSIYDRFREVNALSEEMTRLPGALHRVQIDREEQYAKLTELCANDQNTCRRLGSRRETLRTILNDLQPVTNRDEHSVMVDTRVLINYLSCSPPSDDEGVDGGHHLLISSEECEHNLLHPRDVRHGKLLPKSIYDRLATAIASESDQSTDSAAATNCPTPGDMLCKDCTEMHVIELAAKLDQLEKQKELLVNLNNARGRNNEDCNETALDSDDVYALSRLFEKQFRAHMQRITKAVSDEKLSSIDDLDLTTIEFSLEGMPRASSSASGSGDSEAQGELFVNCSITCRHGNCNSNKKASVMFVPHSTWQKITTLFPNAKCHKTKRRVLQHGSGAASDDILCSLCRQESDSDRNARKRLNDIMKSYRRAVDTVDILSAADLEQKLSDTSSNEVYFAMYKADLDLWKRCTVNVPRLPLRSGETLQQFTQRYLSPQPLGWTPQSCLECSRSDQIQVELIFSFFRPMLCKCHGVPVENALFSDTKSRDTAQLRSDLVFLREESYQDLLVHVVAVTFAIQADDSSNDRDANLDKHEAAQFIDRLKLSHSVHPSVRPRSLFGGTKHAPIPTLIRIPDSFAVCRAQVCVDELKEWTIQEEVIKANKVNAARVSCLQDGNGAAVDNPIVLDSDDEKKTMDIDSFTLRVFETVPGSVKAQVLSAVDQCMAWSSEDPFNLNSFVRRSSRKRKTRYPVGAITEEDTMQMKMTNNVAAIRLCLMERCTNGSVFEPNHTIGLVIRQCTTGPSILVDIDAEESMEDSRKSLDDTHIVYLSFDHNSKTLMEICETILGIDVLKSPLFDPSESIAVLRTSDIDETSREYSKDALMDHLIDLSNVASGSKSGPSSKSRNRAAERGFSGTLLSSGPVGITASAMDESMQSVSTSEPKHAAVAKPSDALIVVSSSEKPLSTIHIKRVAARDVDVEIIDKPKRPTQKLDLGMHGNPSVLESIFNTQPRPGQLESDSDDGSMDELLQTKLPTAKKARSDHGAADDSGDLTMELLELLRQNPDVTDKSASYEAAVWATQEGNPEGEAEAAQLLDVAYSKYLDTVLS